MKKRAILVGLLALGSMLGFGAGDGRAAGGRSAPPRVAAEVVLEGEYTSRDDMAAYVRKFAGALPRNFITKEQARALGWRGGPLEPYAKGKSIGGDRFGNYERRLPRGDYRECDIDTRGRPRGAKRLVYTVGGEHIYYTEDHYGTFEEVKERKDEKRIHN